MMFRFPSINVVRSPNVINIEKRRRLLQLRYKLFSPLYLKEDVEKQMQQQLEQYRQQYEQMYRAAENKAKYYEEQMKRVISSSNKAPNPKDLLADLKDIAKNVEKYPDAAVDLAAMKYSAFVAALEDAKKRGKIAAQDYERMKLEASRIYQDIRNAARQYIMQATTAAETTATKAVPQPTVSVSSGGGGGSRRSSSRTTVKVSTPSVSKPETSGAPETPAERAAQKLREVTSRKPELAEAVEKYRAVMEGKPEVKNYTPEDVVKAATGAALVASIARETYGETSKPSTPTTTSKPKSTFNPFSAISSFFSGLGKLFGG